jgi:DNA mismatch repair protein MutS2
MFHVEHSLEILEFNKLLAVITDFAKSDASREAILAMSPLNSIKDINRRQRQIEEIRLMSQKDKPLKILPFSDIEPFLHKVRPEGAVLDPVELSGIMAFLNTTNFILEQIRDNHGRPFLNDLINGITGHLEILKTLKGSIDSEGNILDSASAALKDLRMKVKGIESRIRKKLDEIMMDGGITPFLQGDFITQRSGRWVIPVRMDSKGQVHGIVHDVSRSGETAFIEPLSIISLSNELENLMAEQKAEEIRILRNISSDIRAVASEIESDFRIIVYIDMLNSIALFADRLRMELPLISDQNEINLVKARHPLLMLAFQKRDMHEQVVPLDVKLSGENTVMVITGPNAGGKTITIKTIGLLVIMALSGMPVPADSSSRIPFIRNLLVDIGDQQSIENNLSTFSAHVSNIAEITKKADSKTLILIDELGTGTDPDEGAALACALLRELKQRGSLLFATTHLTDIKGFVHKEAGMLNASMEFDSMSLTPLYKLRVGEPGQSHAFETARRFGLPEGIIESAKNILGTKKIELDNLIHDINKKRRQYEITLQELQKREAELEKDERRIVEIKAETEASRKDIMANAYKEASEIIASIKKQMHAFLEEMKNRDKEKAKDLMKEVISVQADVAEKAKEYLREEKTAPAMNELKEGDTIFIRSINHEASILKIIRKYNRLKVRAGSIEFEVPISDVGYRVDVTKTEAGSIKIERPEEAESILNIVGLRLDDAISRLEPFLNHAALAGLSEITIIHGIGTGVLSRAVREHLQGHPLVKNFRVGSQKEGGEGITVARLL